MRIDLRENSKGNSTVILNEIISENSKEYWCYPKVELHKFGTLYMDDYTKS